ncbi:MAG: hypothetical protein IIV52_00915, partial [Alistipes sp.]|nr:hypothetical protein [Alistipes sp.]
MVEATVGRESVDMIFDTGCCNANCITAEAAERLASGQDLALTQRVRDAAALFEIRLLDHVIITSNAHYSFRGKGHIK